MPLQGITVIDLSRALAGPYCTTMLADMGAEIIKVESPRGGDPSRAWPPFEGEHSLYFDSANRNKKSVAIDLYTIDGKALLTRMLENADVLVENYKLGTLDAMGFGPEVLRQINPDLIHMSINAYGNKGPLMTRPGLDQVVQGISGLTSVTGDEDGSTYRVGLPIVDITSGMTAAFAVVSMLLGRERGNQSREASTSLFETALALSAFQGQSALSLGVAPTPQGNNHPSIAPYGAFPTATEPVIIAVSTERHWSSFCSVIGRTELADDPRFSTGRTRSLHRQELTELIEEVLRQEGADVWIDGLSAAGIPCGPIYDYAQVMDCEQTRALDMVQSVQRSDGSELRLLRGPLSVDGVPVSVRTAPPSLGEHTRDVLETMGICPEQIEYLENSGTVQAGTRVAATAGANQ
ncbi:CaiB/BaiF CoA transferase family protein [Arthrobacter crystallopoietes]|uniref:Crotonobetainyl-CoA:carnitine CoA-transferase CaiB n=1 Tax=Crystallibacter crystallopoietes TaxID=37928 RepID=A0A1H1BRZ8_9MICC|nr:CoA transferase [Arthrobacter crystallopoietes]AUI51043.1 CoA transferase [Arthrobacter crystallopoietes]SDQ54732.1 Crotonobetainyl-CoA:carnitine CoA-transferase CaiB [Arthrobacter crystallopoietes]